MEWYENMSKIMSQNINERFFTNYINFVKQKIGEEKTELLRQNLDKFAIEWQQRENRYREYRIYGIAMFDMSWFIEEFSLDDRNDTDKYLYMIFFLTDLYIAINDSWDVEEPNDLIIKEIDEKQFFDEITKCVEISFRRFNHRNERYGNDEYAQKIFPQYQKLEKYLAALKNLKGESRVIKVTESISACEESICYFIENQNKISSIRIEDWM